MRRSLAASILIGAIGLTSAASAKELYDPNLLSYDPKPVALPECGVNIGLDPTWTFEARSKQTDRYTNYFYDFKSNATSKRRPFDAFVFTPLLNGFVNCHASFNNTGEQRTGETLKRHAKSSAERSRQTRIDKADARNVSAVEEILVAGLDLAYVFHAEIPPKQGSEFKTGGVTFWLYGTKGDILVHAWIRLADPVGGKQRLSKGEMAVGKDKGKTMSVRLANDATLVEKVYYGSRTLEQDRDYVMAILRSMR